MDYNIVNIASLTEGQGISEGILYLTEYSKKPFKSGTKFFIVGTMSNKEMSIPFKVWDSELVDLMDKANLEGQIVKITGEITKYQGNLEVKLNAIQGNLGDSIPATIFLKSVDVDKVFKEFATFVNTELSEKAIKLLMGIFQSENLFPRFKEEFAGKKMHDAQIGGLMYHTTKMLRIAKTIVDNEPRMKEIEDFTDLLYLGVSLHDIGKVHEMNLGVYQPNSFVTHRTIGTELLVKYKDLVCQLYNETFFYQILAILNGHHGEYGERPQTLLAYIIHLIDMLESMTTGAFDKIEKGEFTNKAGHDAVLMNGSYLVI